MLLLYILIALAIVFVVPPIRRVARHPLGHADPGRGSPAHGRDRAHRARGRHRLVGRRALLGAPRWKQLLEFKPKPLTTEERAFLDGPVEELCRMVDDWDVIQQRRPLARGLGATSRSTASSA